MGYLNNVKPSDPVVVVYPTKGVEVMRFSEAVAGAYKWTTEPRIFPRDFAKAHLEELTPCSPEWQDFIRACRKAWPREFTSVA